MLLDNISSVNYGNSHVVCGDYNNHNDNCRFDNYYNTELHDMNPLLYCCYSKKIDLVKLLIEKYNAAIETQSKWGTTAIMFSAQQDDIMTTKYLYEKGAKLIVTDQNIKKYATPNIMFQIKEWENKKCQDHITLILQKYNKDYDRLKVDYDRLKSDIENIKSLLEVKTSTNN